MNSVTVVSTVKMCVQTGTNEQCHCSVHCEDVCADWQLGELNRCNVEHGDVCAD